MTRGTVVLSQLGGAIIDFRSPGEEREKRGRVGEKFVKGVDKLAKNKKKEEEQEEEEEGEEGRIERIPPSLPPPLRARIKSQPIELSYFTRLPLINHYY